MKSVLYLIPFIPLIAIAGFLAFVVIIVASRTLDTRRWRQCVKCWCWFSDMGDTSKTHPASLNMDDPGICPDCTNDIRFNREN